MPLVCLYCLPSAQTCRVDPTCERRVDHSAGGINGKQPRYEELVAPLPDLNLACFTRCVRHPNEITLTPRDAQRSTEACRISFWQSGPPGPAGSRRCAAEAAQAR